MLYLIVLGLLTMESDNTSSQDVAVAPRSLYTLIGPDPWHSFVLQVALQMLPSSFATGWGA